MGTRSRDATDYVGLVEAAYDIGSSEERWLQRICDGAAPSLDLGMGAFALRYNLDADADRMPTFVGSAMTDERLQVLQAMIRGCPPDQLRQFCGHELNCGTGKRRFAARGLSYEDLFASHAREGIRDARYATVPATDRSGIMLGGYTSGEATVPPGTLHMWLRTLCHLALGWKLRRRLRDARTPAHGEAVLGPDGKVEHAEGPARHGDVREALRSAVRNMDRARGPLRRRDPSSALELWRGLVSGRWSLVERFESDGRRYLVAHPNPPDVVDVRAWSRRERLIARLVARGYAVKLVAYELGVRESTVSNQLASLRHKLGVRTTPELVQLLRVMGEGKPFGSTAG